MRPAALFPSLTLLVALPAALPAQTVDQDVRCVMAGNLFGGAEKDPVRKQMALATALFFGGRADARLAPAQMKAVVAAQAKALTPANAPGVMTGCARLFQAKERAMQQVGREVSQAAAPARPPVGKP